MRLRTSDPALTDDLVRFLRSRECLAVKRGPHDVEVVPITPTGRHAERARIERFLDDWLAANPGARVDLSD